MGLSGIWLITLSYDEAWILRGIDGILNAQTAATAVPPVLTSGGLFAIAQVLIVGVVGSELWIQRSFSVLCAGLILLLVYKWARRLSDSPHAGALGISALIATPGFLVLGSTAYATLPALLLTLACFHVYVSFAAGTWRRRLSLGLLGGLAAATRFNCVFALPVLLLLALACPKQQRSKQVLDVVLASALGALVMMGCVFLYSSVGNSELVTAQQVTGSAFRSSLINYPNYLNSWNIAEGFAPFPLLVLASCVGVLATFSSRNETAANSSSPAAALTLFGWMAWAGWLVASPIPHLRYLLPALAVFWICIGLGIACLHSYGQRNAQPWLRIAALVIALSCATSAIGSNARNMIHGNGNLLSWEWAGQSRVTYFTRLRHMQYQMQAAEYLRDTTEEGEAILALGLNKELGYLADRPVEEGRILADRGYWDPAKLPRRFFLSPVVGSFIYFKEEARLWIESNCSLEAQFGPYSFYRVDGSYPEEFSFLRASGKAYAGHPMSGEYR